jgi:hypothetical protein
MNRAIGAFYTCTKNASTILEVFVNGFAKYGFSGTLVRKMYGYTNPQKNISVHHIN